MDTVAPPVRVFLVDDHEVVRRGVAEVLEDDPGHHGRRRGRLGAPRRWPGCRPSGPTSSSSTCGCPTATAPSSAAACASGCPGLRCLVLTSYSEQEALRRRRPGRGGGLPAQAGARAGPGLGRAHRGGRRHAVRGRSPGRAAQPADRWRPAATGSALLTDQERTVLRLIGEGLTNRQIGDRMGLAEKTVKNYTSHLLAKLGLERRTQAAILATQLRDRARG